MKVKKYVVDSMPEALQKIRAELGKDAVIINTKEIRVGGIAGLFSKKKIEVVAAVDSNPDPGRPARSAALPVQSVHRPPSAAYGAAKPSPAAAEGVWTSTLPTEPASQQEPKPLLSAPPLIPGPPLSKNREDVLLQEITQMKEMMHKLAGAQATAAAAVGKVELQEKLPEPFERLRGRLVQQDVLPDLALRIVEQAYAARNNDDSPTASFAGASEAVKHQMVNILTQQPAEQIRPEVKIVHFVGPTGVGKTTTIAKLAAEQVLKQRKNVGLITSDTYRIAAIEQLRTYASILNVPLEVVFSAMDLQKAMDKYADRDLILMDTAGRNFRNEMAVSELHSLLRVEESRDAFLVLSLGMKYNDMKAVTDNFHKFGFGKVLFTKADETDSFGSVLNLLYDFPLSLSYMTTGQNVPDDIQLADALKIAEEIAGDIHDE